MKAPGHHHSVHTNNGNSRGRERPTMLYAVLTACGQVNLLGGQVSGGPVGALRGLGHHRAGLDGLKAGGLGEQAAAGGGGGSAGLPAGFAWGELAGFASRLEMVLKGNCRG